MYYNNQWIALDEDDRHPLDCFYSDRDGDVVNDADLISDIEQSSDEVIIIRDSCDVDVVTTDTKVAVSLQAALQVAIAVVINITIADEARAERVTQELLEFSQIRQTNRQRLVIVNCRSVDVTTSDTDVAVSLQLMLQILVALLVQLDIL